MLLRSSQKQTSALFFYGFAILISSILSFIMMRHAGFPGNIPIAYQGDGLLYAAMIKNFLETGSYLHNAFLGAPLSLNLADFPNDDYTDLLILKIISYFGANYGLVMNRYFFIVTPLLTLLFSVFVARRFGMNRAFSLVLGVLYAYLPYHMLRNEGHFFLQSYFVVPLYTLIIFQFILYPPKKEKTNLYWYYLIGFALLIFSASAFVYYTFFAAYLVLAIGSIASLRQISWQPLKRALILTGLITTILIINLLPSILYQAQTGRNSEAAAHAPSDSERFGLKIADLLFPVNQHTVPIAKAVKQMYANSTPFSSESTATLGAIGSIGFLFSIGYFFTRKNLHLENNTPSYLTDLAQLNIAALLFGTVGGFGTIFAYLISPQIRAYNRISVFIAFFSLLIFFITLQVCVEKLKKYPSFAFIHKRPLLNQGVFYFSAFMLCLFGLADQIPRAYTLIYRPAISDASRNMLTLFQSDQAFVQQIEKKLPQNSMVFTLPVASLPEVPTIYHMPDYDLLRGYVHSRYLHWSYGAIRGRAADTWQEKIKTLPLPIMLDQIIAAQFNGLYINLDAYEDHGKTLISSLTQLLQQTPLISNNHDLAFFDLRQYARMRQNQVSQNNWHRLTQTIKNQLALNVACQKCYPTDLDTQTNTRWRWTQSNHPTLTIYNASQQNISARLQFDLPIGPQANKIKISLRGDMLPNSLHYSLLPQNTQSTIHITKNISLSPGKHILALKSNIKCFVPAQNDGRYLCLQIKNLSLQPIEPTPEQHA